GDPCGPNGACVNTVNGYACQCANGYSGVLNCSSECGDTLDVSGGLAAAIKGLLYGDPTRPDPILLADLAGFVALDANGDQFSVTDLSGLECWTHLETLYLDNN